MLSSQPHCRIMQVVRRSHRYIISSAISINCANKEISLRAAVVLCGGNPIV